MNLPMILQVQAQQTAGEFMKLDQYGIGMAIIAITIVFGVLAVIYLTIKYFSRLYSLNFSKKSSDASSASNKAGKTDVSSEVSAAIALAIHLYTNEQHDLDSFTLTINKVSRMYSPWSSKIYTLRQLPRS